MTRKTKWQVRAEDAAHQLSNGAKLTKRCAKMLWRAHRVLRVIYGDTSPLVQQIGRRAQMLDTCAKILAHSSRRLVE